MTSALGVTMAQSDGPSVNYLDLARLLLTPLSQRVRAALVDLARAEQLGSAIEDALAAAQAFSPAPEGEEDVYAAHASHVRDAFRQFEWLNEGVGLPGFHRFVRKANDTVMTAMNISHCSDLCHQLLEMRGDDGTHLITSERVRAYLEEFLSVLRGVQGDHFLNSKQLPGAMRTSIRWFENAWRIVKNCTPQSMPSQYRAFEQQIGVLRAQREMKDDDPEVAAMERALAGGRYQDLLQIFLENLLPIDGEAPHSRPMERLPASCAMKSSRVRSISGGVLAETAAHGASMCASSGQIFCQPTHAADMPSIVTETFPGLLVRIYPCAPSFIFR